MITSLESGSLLLPRCVRPQFQWYQLAYATEMKSISIAWLYRRAQPKDSIHYVSVNNWMFRFRIEYYCKIRIPLWYLIYRVGDIIIWQYYYLAILLFGNIIIWQYYYLAILLFGDIIIWQYYYLAILLFGNIIIWWYYYLAILLFGNIIIWQYYLNIHASLTPEFFLILHLVFLVFDGFEVCSMEWIKHHGISWLPGDMFKNQNELFIHVLVYHRYIENKVSNTSRRHILCIANLELL